MTEKDLFGPIKAYFEKAGYTCDGEVGGIDLFMQKGDETVAVELKCTLDFKAVQQAALRQKVTDTVFIGIFMPKDLRSSSFRDRLYLLKRLGIGLLAVSPRSGVVSVVNEPVVSELSDFKGRNKGKRNALESEFSRRRVKNNIGGVHGTKLMTGYREDSLLVLDALCELGGEAPARKVRELSGVEKASAILRSNHYDWFGYDRERAVYGVTEAGYAALEEFEEAMIVLKRRNSEI